MSSWSSTRRIWLVVPERFDASGFDHVCGDAWGGAAWGGASNATTKTLVDNLGVDCEDQVSEVGSRACGSRASGNPEPALDTPTKGAKAAKNPTWNAQTVTWSLRYREADGSSRRKRFKAVANVGDDGNVDAGGSKLAAYHCATNWLAENIATEKFDPDQDNAIAP